MRNLINNLSQINTRLKPKTFDNVDQDSIVIYDVPPIFYLGRLVCYPGNFPEIISTPQVDKLQWLFQLNLGVPLLPLFYRVDRRSIF